MAKAPKSDLLDKIKERSTISLTSTLADSKFINDKDFIPTQIPMLNVLLSGSLDGGLTSGLTMFAGESKNFKTGLLLLLMKAFQDKHKEGVILFYVSEFGSPEAYFDNFGIDKKRVIITPITDIEQLKIDMIGQLDGLKWGDKVFIGIDSIGNLASRKELEDALDGKTTTDMTRARALKSLFRIVTPHLTLKNIPCVAINHVYKTLELYAKTIVSGGSGGILSSDNIFIITRSKDEEGTGKDKELLGYKFKVRAEKSRSIKEGSTIILDVPFSTGVSKWSGLLEASLDAGHVIKVKEGNSIRYKKAEDEELFTEEQINTKEFWEPIMKDSNFNAYIEKTFKFGGQNETP